MKHNPGWILLVAALANFALGVWNVAMFSWHTVFVGVLNFITSAMCTVCFYRNVRDIREHERFMAKIKKDTEEFKAKYDQSD